MPVNRPGDAQVVAHRVTTTDRRGTSSESWIGLPNAERKSRRSLCRHERAATLSTSRHPRMPRSRSGYPQKSSIRCSDLSGVVRSHPALQGTPKGFSRAPLPAAMNLYLPRRRAICSAKKNRAADASWSSMPQGPASGPNRPTNSLVVFMRIDPVTAPRVLERDVGVQTLRLVSVECCD